jgi:hypothetical protein
LGEVEAPTQLIKKFVVEAGGSAVDYRGLRLDSESVQSSSHLNEPFLMKFLFSTILPSVFFRCQVTAISESFSVFMHEKCLKYEKVHFDFIM